MPTFEGNNADGVVGWPFGNAVLAYGVNNTEGINVAVVVDASHSMFVDQDTAMPVGDLDGDGVSNTQADLAYWMINDLAVELDAYATSTNDNLNLRIIAAGVCCSQAPIEQVYVSSADLDTLWAAVQVARGDLTDIDTDYSINYAGQGFTVAGNGALQGAFTSEASSCNHQIAAERVTGTLASFGTGVTDNAYVVRDYSLEDLCICPADVDAGIIDGQFRTSGVWISGGVTVQTRLIAMPDNGGVPDFANASIVTQTSYNLTSGAPTNSATSGTGTLPSGTRWLRIQVFVIDRATVTIEWIALTVTGDEATDLEDGIDAAIAWFGTIGADDTQKNRIITMTDGKISSGSASTSLATWETAYAGMYHARLLQPNGAPTAGEEAQTEALNNDAITSSDPEFFAYDTVTGDAALTAAIIFP